MTQSAAGTDAGCDELKVENARLVAENARLRSEVEFLRCHPTLAKGLRGETLVAKLLGARYTDRGSGYDLVSSNNKIEVKYSSLGARRDCPLKRWNWTKLLGEQGRKRYDRLLLVGEADPRFAAHYADPRSPYVFFDLPYEAVITIVGGLKRGRAAFIQLPTNPLTVRSRCSVDLFESYQVSAADLKRRYAGLLNDSKREYN